MTRNTPGPFRRPAAGKNSSHLPVVVDPPTRRASAGAGGAAGSGNRWRPGDGLGLSKYTMIRRTPFSDGAFQSITPDQFRALAARTAR